MTKVIGAVVGIKDGREIANKLGDKYDYLGTEDGVDLVDLPNTYHAVWDFFNECYGEDKNEIISLKHLFKNAPELVKYVDIDMDWDDLGEDDEDASDAFIDWADENGIEFKNVTAYEPDEIGCPEMEVSIKADNDNIVKFYDAYEDNQDGLYSLDDLAEIIV